MGICIQVSAVSFLGAGVPDVSSSLGLSGVNQLTLITLSYSSMLLIGIGM